MSLSRRKTLSLLGGGAIFAAGGFGYSVTRPLQKALKPWEVAGQYTDARMRALSFAILAPNPHNMQPWKIDLSRAEHVLLYVDMERLLPETDPFNRQITIGLGCFLEVMRMAAAQDGIAVTFDLFPEGFDDTALDSRPVASARFTKGGAIPDPLFAHVMTRRSLKEPFDTSREVTQAHLDTLIKAANSPERVGGTVQPDDVMFWRQLTHDALRVEIETPRTFQESVDVFRIGRSEVDANPDGIDFSGPLFQTLHMTGLMTREAMADTSSIMFVQGLDAVLENTDTAMGHIWMTTEGNSRVDQIAAGRDWVRINLAATGIGLGFHPLSQPLQEYPEMAAHFETTNKRLAPGGETVQMLARVGYGITVPPSPRWNVEAKLI